MSATYERLDGSKVRITFNVDAAEFDKAINTAYRNIKNKINIPGFRKGKIPRQMIETYYGKDFFHADAVEILLQPSYQKALEELADEIIPVGRPEADIKEISKETGVVFTVEVITEPEVTVSDYKGITYSAKEQVITDEDTDKEIDRIRTKNARLVTVTDRSSLLNDELNINFKGYIDGVPFEGGEAEEYDIVLGSNTFIPGFEDQLMNRNTGDEFDVNVTFPDDYPNEEVRGKDASFSIKINEIRERILPEADDEFAQDVSEYDTLDEYREELKKQLAEKAKDAYESEKRAQLLSKIANLCQGDIPECMIEERLGMTLDEITERFGGYITIEQYARLLGTTEEALRATLREDADMTVKSRLALAKIAQYENITVTDEEFDAKLDEYADITKAEDPKQLKDFVYSSKMRCNEYRRDLLISKAYDFIVEHAVFEEEKEDKQ